jgi:DNA-binding PadR family transcriptional regulator
VIDDRMLPLTPVSLAVLLALAEGEMHGYALMREVEEQSEGKVRPGTGTLYAALQRMMEEGLVEESKRRRGRGEDGRRRYYAITGFGREVARAELERLERLVKLGASRKLIAERGRG